MAKRPSAWVKYPSWWIVLVAGALVIIFSISIVRELINGHTVRQQVKRLHDQVASEQQRHHQLQDLIDYLGSPTFQEQEARLKLGLKKSGEQVIVVPPSNNSTHSSDGLTSAGVDNTSEISSGHPQRWWRYFFGAKPLSDSSNA